MALPSDIQNLIQRGETEKALRLAKAASQRAPRDPNALDQLARTYVAARDTKRALATYERLIKLRPRHARPLADRALLLQQLGQADAANADLRRGLAVEPLNGSMLRMLTATEAVPAADPIAKRMHTAWTRGDLKGMNKVHAGFALAKIFGRPDMPILHAANALQRDLHPWSIEPRQREIAALKQSFLTRPWRTLPQSSSDGTVPIFVTGMPRSGTTLVEQILACHRDVSSYGETGLPLRAQYSVIQNGATFRGIATLSAQDLGVIGERYLSAMAHFHGARGVFTDKSMQSYLTIGLMHHILPQARCVVVKRDPRDVGWSIYRNLFEGGAHSYSTELGDIGRYYATFHDMVEFWRDLRPDAFFELKYEDLVRDPEPVVRRLLDYCGLPWDPACLHPEASARAVKTLSIEQVRSPMSPKPIGGWRAVESELRPMIDALGDLVKPWD